MQDITSSADGGLGAPQFLSPADLRRELGMSRHTVYELLNRGHLPGQKLGGLWRTRRSDLEQLFEKHGGKRAKSTT